MEKERIKQQEEKEGKIQGMFFFLNNQEEEKENQDRKHKFVRVGKKMAMKKWEMLFLKVKLHPTNGIHNNFCWIGALVGAGSLQPS
jgi:hypothetical protein